MLIFSEYYGDFFSLKINIIKIKKYFFIFNYNYIIIFYIFLNFRIINIKINFKKFCNLYFIYNNNKFYKKNTFS